MATQAQYPAFRLVSKQTRPGTKPGNPGGNRLVCVSNGVEPARRVPRSVASGLVNLCGWHYISKFAYKAAQ